ncbi:hypothetical protein [Humidesulfovibrio sp.]
MLNETDLSEYKILGNVMLSVSSAIKGQEATDFEISIEDIFRKFFQHYTTAIQIYTHPTQIDTNGAIALVVDHSSIKVVTRSAIESYLTFFWIFESTIRNPEMREFRFSIWILTSLYWRVKLTGLSEEFAKNISESKEYIAKLEFDFKTLSIFSKLQSKDKTQCLKCIRSGRELYNRPSWKKLMEQSGIDPFFCQLYTYLCDYSHTGSISTMQIRESNTTPGQERFSKVPLQMNMIIAAKFIRGFGKFFDVANDTLEQHESASIVNFYAQMGETSLESLGIT